MKVFVLSDPHYGRDMSRYGALWIDHPQQIRRHWLRVVSHQDLVLIPGDFSWAVTTKTIEKHLDEVNGLKGRVIISPGNHDRWWRKTERLRYANVSFLENDHVALSPTWTLAAAVGHECPESPWWEERFRPEFEEAKDALRRTLDAARSARSGTRILLMLHYPPRWDGARTPTDFERIVADYPVDLVVYGHIHGDDLVYAHNRVVDLGGRAVRYENASCDRILFKPLEVLRLEDAIQS